MLTEKEIDVLRKAAMQSGSIIAKDKKLTPTHYGRKTPTGLGNVFLLQLEKLMNLRPGTLQNK